jgi:transposase
LSGLTYSVKKTLQAQERDEEARKAWREAILKLAPDTLVFLDETSGWLGMTRVYARILGGGRIYDTAPKKRKGKVSLLAAITPRGMKADACLIHEGSVDTSAFLTYLEQVLLPTLEPGQIVIMDNFTIHHNAHVQTLIESKGCTVLYLPTYSPDFNPIEHLFAKIKAFIRKLRPDTLPTLIKTFENAVLSVSPDDAKNAFNHCGYLSQ